MHYNDRLLLRRLQNNKLRILSEALSAILPDGLDQFTPMNVLDKYYHILAIGVNMPGACNMTLNVGNTILD